MRKILKNMDWLILISAVLLVCIGLIALVSATGDATNYSELKKQVVWFGVSLIIMAIVISIDYNTIAKLSVFMYIGTIGLLVAVLFTKPINGATSWFNFGSMSFQPAELAKISIIICLAGVIVKMKEKDKDGIGKLKNLIIIGVFLIVPLGLIIKQPDYGTAMVFVSAIALILYVSGIKARYIGITILVVIIALPLLYYFVLPLHAQNRIKVFLNPGSQPRGIGYNVIQSKLAIGSGMLTGMGLFKGNQTQLGYLYPKTTDFIFSVIGEELGFIVAGLVIILNIIIVVRSIQISKTSKDTLGSLIAVGISGIFLFHMTENIGMTMGILPITGIPLPFVSYGGSSLLTNFIAIGLLLNISGRRQKSTFAS